MANSYSGNVIHVDTSAAFDYARNISAIKYVGASNGTATIKRESSSGDLLWGAAGSSDLQENVNIRSSKGIYVTLANSAAVYIYLKD